MKSTKNHLDELKNLRGQISVATGAMVVAQMMPHFAEFLDEWAERAERLQKWIRGFTIALFVLTAALVVLTAALVGLTWRLAKYGQQNDEANRYEMRLTPAGEVVRLDKVTGTLHIATGSFVGDLPEQVVKTPTPKPWTEWKKDKVVSPPPIDFEPVSPRPR
jgi:hypothetical protein